MTRKQQRWWLLILTSITLMSIYAIQGIMTHSGPNDVPGWLWTAEWVSWAFRAVVEIMAIGFLAETKTATRLQGVIVLALEVVMIGLIMATLGPVITAIGQGKTMYEYLETTGLKFWGYGLAAYAPLMIAAISTGYKIMPIGLNENTPAYKGVNGVVNTLDTHPKTHPVEPQNTPKRKGVKARKHKLSTNPDNWKIPLREVKAVYTPGDSGATLAEKLGNQVSVTVATKYRDYLVQTNGKANGKAGG